MSESVGVVVVGAGSAGLAVSHELTTHGVDHVVLERGRVAQTWRDRWDSFCLVTPNWYVKLPGGEYDGPDPEGFMPRDELVAHIEGYAASFGAPVREGVDVSALDVAPHGGFRLRTSQGDLLGETVVVSTGAYQRPHRPSGAATLPQELLQLDAEGYTNPDALPAGDVLVVGSGQTGCQIAEELHLAGRNVFLACGRAPWCPRRFDGRDMVAWIADTPFFDTLVSELPNPAARLIANVQATGHGGGHDLHYRVLQAMGVTLLGHLIGGTEQRALFAADLAESVAFGDQRYGDLRGLISKSCAARGARPPEMPDPPRFRADPPDSLDLTGFGAVIFTSGFRPDYRRWVALPDAFDELGFPVQVDGACSAAEGLYFAGAHFLRKRKSALLLGVGEDAAIVAAKIAERHAAPTASVSR